MKKRYWFRGFWIGTLVGIVLFMLNMIITLIADFIIKFGENLFNPLPYISLANWIIPKTLMAVNYTAFFFIYLFVDIIFIALIGMLIGGIFKKKK